VSKQFGQIVTANRVLYVSRICNKHKRYWSVSEIEVAGILYAIVANSQHINRPSFQNVGLHWPHVQPIIPMVNLFARQLYTDGHSD